MSPADTAALRLHAIYVCLGDTEFLPPSIRSVYDHVDGITIVTNHDRDWKGRHRAPGPLVDMVLDRSLDPDRKIDLLVTRESNEARSRNRAMDFADPSPKSRRVRVQHDGDETPPPVDYFLVVDADEVWDGEDLERLKRYAAGGRRPVYRVGAVTYFRRWIYRVEGHEWLTALVRADHRFTVLRNHLAPWWRRGLARFVPMPAAWRSRLTRVEDVPTEVAVFHHGSYVGPRARIEAKLASSGHADQVRPGWMSDVYDRWDDRAVDFHPVWPKLFSRVATVPVDQLPRSIQGHAWPAEYLE